MGGLTQRFTTQEPGSSLALFDRSEEELANLIATAVTQSQVRAGEIWYLRCPKKGKITNGSGSAVYLQRVHSFEVRRLAQAVAFFPYWRAMINSYPGINCTLQSFDGVTGNPIPFLEEFYDLGIDCISEFGRIHKLPPPVVVGALSQEEESARPAPVAAWPETDCPAEPWTSPDGDTPCPECGWYDHHHRIGCPHGR